MSAPVCVSLKRGSLYLGREVHALYFAGLETVILLRRDDDLLILPVRNAAAGGYLLKRRNGAGDRVVTAPDFFRDNGIGDDIERTLTAAWEDETAALRANGAFRLNT